MPVRGDDAQQIAQQAGVSASRESRERWVRKPPAWTVLSAGGMCFLRHADPRVASLISLSSPRAPGRRRKLSGAYVF